MKKKVKLVSSSRLDGLENESNEFLKTLDPFLSIPQTELIIDVSRGYYIMKIEYLSNQ